MITLAGMGQMARPWVCWGEGCQGGRIFIYIYMYSYMYRMYLFILIASHFPCLSSDRWLPALCQTAREQTAAHHKMLEKS